ncbi:MAG: hypothetical protein ABGY75_09100 [Gemmataceae bacterium]
MRTLFLLAAAGVAAAAPVPKGIKKPAALDGRWRLVEAEYDGQPQDVSRAADWYIDGEWFRLGQKPAANAKAGLKLVRDEANPAHVEYHNVRVDGTIDRYLGLLEVTDEEMKFCYGTRGGPRPGEMAPAKGVTYRVFKRVEER